MTSPADQSAVRDETTSAPAEGTAPLGRVLVELRDQIDALRFTLDVPGADEAVLAAREIRDQLEDYVLPRVRQAATPLLAVLGGSTGAGKSTLVNSLVGSRVSGTGVLRPTTSSPILVCSPEDFDWFMGTDGRPPGVLPTMGRVEGPAPDAVVGDQLVVIRTEAVPRGLAVLDSPDFDSLFDDHYEFATKLMAAADLWVCVTTAARYADAQVWRMLERAREQGATLGVVLSRVQPGPGEEIAGHFTEMLAERGFGEVPRFDIPETTIVDSRLPEETISGIREWLLELAENAEARDEMIVETLGGVLDSFRTRVPQLAKQVEEQVDCRDRLARDADAAYSTALAELDEATRNGSLLQGEVLARWQDFAGTGDLMRALRLRRGRAAAPKGSARRRRSAPRVHALKAALRSALEALILAAAEQGAEQAVQRWQADAPGRLVLGDLADQLGHVSPELPRRITRAVSAWQDHVLELVRTEGVVKRSLARVVSFDDEALSVVLMVGILGYGTSDVVVGGTSAVPQRLLKSLFGAESLRGMSSKAKADLRKRVTMLLDEESLRFSQAIDQVDIPDESLAVALYQATYNLEVAR